MSGSFSNIRRIGALFGTVCIIGATACASFQPYGYQFNEFSFGGSFFFAGILL